jgi:hypothetical protein
MAGRRKNTYPRAKKQHRRRGRHAPAGLQMPLQDQFLSKSVMAKLVSSAANRTYDGTAEGITFKVGLDRADQIMERMHDAQEVDMAIQDKLKDKETYLNHPSMQEIFPEDREKIAARLAQMALDKFERHEKTKRVHIIENLDLLREANDKHYHANLRRVQELAPVAKRFIFDEEASKHVGLFIKDHYETLIDHRQFAIPPYETTYIQVDIDAVIKAISHGSTADRPGWDGSRDLETAYLIHDRMVYPMARGEGAGGLSLFKYEMLGHQVGENCPCKPIFFGEPMYNDDKQDHILRAMLLLGSTYNQVGREKYIPFLHSAQIHLSVDPETYNKFAPAEKEKWRKRNWQMIISSAGDYRVMLAALLLINQQKYVETIHIPANSMLIGGKRKVVKAHNRVVIRLHNFDVIKRELGHKLLTPRAEHEVRGHLRNVRVLRGCFHEWKDLSDPSGIRRWACAKCNGLRTTVRPHKRGDAAVGTTTKSYDVKE